MDVKTEAGGRDDGHEGEDDYVSNGSLYRHAIPPTARFVPNHVRSSLNLLSIKPGTGQGKVFLAEHEWIRFGIPAADGL
jgi:hypothetical protein